MAVLNRLLITGAGGMIGRQIPFGLKPSREELDVTSPQAVRRILEKSQPSGVLHLAAVDLRGCEENPRLAIEANVLGTYHLAQACRALSIPLIYVSTGAVFNGPAGAFFSEADPPHPLNLYAQTKYAAERLIQDAGTDHLILRTGWLFGGSAAHQKKIVDLAAEQARAGLPIQASADQTGSPTYVADFVKTLGILIENGARGIRHVVNAGQATAFDMAAEIIRILRSKSRLEKTPASQFVPATLRRSASETLISETIRLRPWQETLQEYLQNIP